MDRRQPWYVRNPDWWREPAPPVGGNPIAVGWLVLLLAASGLLLRHAFGWPPPLPPAWPTWQQVGATLRGSEVAPTAIWYGLGLGSWLVWCWLVLTVVLQVVLSVLETITRGARWVRALHAGLDRLTLPAIRRLVHGAVVTATVVQLAARTVPTTLAAPAPPSAAVAMVTATSHPHTTNTGAGHRPAVQPSTVTYRVQPGDGLWQIAEHFYGDGNAWPKILAANVGRTMPDGEVFSRAPVLQSGWVLLIPDVLPSAETAPAPHETYLVRSGDTLWSIARRFYGDGRQWPRIFAASRGATLPDGHRLEDPNLIWPGLTLAVPGVSASPAIPVPAAAPAIQPSPPPVPAVKPQAPPPKETPPEHPLPSTARPSVTPAPTAAHPAGTPAASIRTAPPPAGASPTAAPAPTATATPAPRATTSRPSDLPMPDATDLAALAGIAAVAVGAASVRYLGRRTRLRRGREVVVEPGVPLRDGYIDAELVGPLAHRLAAGQREPVVALVGEVRRFLTDHALAEIAVVTVAERRRGGATLLLRATLGEAARLLALEDELGRALAAGVRVVRRQSGDLLLEIRGRARLRLLPPDRAAFPPVPLTPLGALADGATWYGNWSELGHVLVAGTPGGGTAALLTSLVSGLAARCAPDELRLWTLAGRDALPEGLLALPHQRDERLDPADADAVGALLRKLRVELERRMAGADPALPPRLVLVLADPPGIAALPDAAEADLGMLERHGALHGIQLLVGTADPAALDHALLSHCHTRLVFRMPDEELSVRLLGDPCAAELDGGGHMAVRIGDGQPVLAYAYRVAPEELRAFVALLRRACPTIATGAQIATPVEDSSPEEERSGPPDAHTAPGANDACARPPSDAIGQAVDAYEPTREPAAEDAASGEGGAAPSPTATVTTAAALATAQRPDVPETASSPGGAPTTPLLSVECLGGFRVVGPGGRVVAESAAVQQKVWGVLAYLAVRAGDGVVKEELLETFWRDEDVEAAGKALRSTLTRLRGLLSEAAPDLPATAVRVERSGSCRLDPAWIRSDVQDFLDRCRRAKRATGEEAIQLWEEAVARYTGELLEGTGCGWLDERQDGVTPREQVQGEYFAALHELAQRRLRAGDITGAAARYERILAEEPTFEEAARWLYRCYGKLGDRTATVRAHRRLEAALQELYLTPGEREPDPSLWQPEAETLRVYRSVLAALDRRGGELELARAADRADGD